MAKVELIHEKTGRKVTVNDASAEFYKELGWAEPAAKPKAKAGSGNADSDTGESAAAAGKTTKRGANTAS